MAKSEIEYCGGSAEGERSEGQRAMTLSVDIHKPAGLPEGEALQPSAREKLPEGAVEAAVPAVPEQVSNAKDRAVDDGAEAAAYGQTPDSARIRILRA